MQKETTKQPDEPHMAQRVTPYVQHRFAAVREMWAAESAAAVASRLAATAPADLRERYEAEAKQHMDLQRQIQARIDAIDAVVADLGEDAARWYEIIRRESRKAEAAQFERAAG